MITDEMERRSLDIERACSINPDLRRKTEEAYRMADEMFMEKFSWPFRQLWKLFQKIFR